MEPRWDQPNQLFAVACLSDWFVKQLYFDLIKDPGSLARPNRPEIISDAFRVSDLVHNIFLTSRADPRTFDQISDPV